MSSPEWEYDSASLHHYSNDAEYDSTEDEDEEEQIYRLIYDMITTDDKEEKEEVQIPASTGSTPTLLKIHTESGSEGHTTNSQTQAQKQDDQEVDNPNEQDIDTIILEVKAEEKPWRKAGVDITDYFNYGFDEKTWNTYCRKQSKLCTANKKLYNKIKIQKGHTRHEEEPCSSPSSGRPSILASREPSATADVTDGRPRPCSRMKGRPSLCAEGNNAQVVTEMSLEEDGIASYHLSPPSNVNSLFAYTTPSLFLYRHEPPPLSPCDTLDSGHCQGIGDPSTSLYSPSSGESSLIPRSMASRAGLTDTAKAWGSYIKQEKCNKYRDRSKEHGHNKNSERGRDRNRESCSSSHNSGEEHMRHRDSIERGHKCQSLERSREENNKRHRERRHRDKNEGRQISTCSSSSSSSRSRRDGSEGRDIQSRYKHKKAKRKRQDKDTEKMFSADQERKLNSD